LAERGADDRGDLQARTHARDLLLRVAEYLGLHPLPEVGAATVAVQHALRESGDLHALFRAALEELADAAYIAADVIGIEQLAGGDLEAAFAHRQRLLIESPS